MNRMTSIVIALAALTSSAAAQSLYKRAGGRSASLVSDLRASSIGDILTVVIREEHKIEQEDKTNRSTTSSFKAQVDIFQIANTKLAPKFPSIGAGSERSFTGNAKQERDASFEARVAVTVVDVLPNGNLVISGRRTVQVDDEEKTLRISGVVRPLDVTALNTVNSAQVAEARVAIEGKGANTQANTRGPVAVFFQTLWWAIWPF
jgi:flagellar L-ring protein precursor FlgH